MDLLTLKQAGEVISANNGGLSIAVSTLQSWAKAKILPTSRLGNMYVVNKDVAENFVVADHVRPKGNPNWAAGLSRPRWTKCDHFTPQGGRCKKKARWQLGIMVSDEHAIVVKRCDAHKDELLERAKGDGFTANIVAVEPMPRQN